MILLREVVICYANAKTFGANPGFVSGKYHKYKNHLTVLFIFMVISAGVEPALTG